MYILNEENKNRNKKIGKIIGKILLVEFALCFVWAIFNAIVGIESGGTWIFSIQFNGLSAFIFTMLIGVIISVMSNVVIIIVYEMISLIHRAYKEQNKGQAVLLTIILTILVYFFINWLMWI